MRSLGRWKLFSAYFAAAGLLASPAALADSDVWKTAANGAWGAGGSWVDGSTPSSIFDTATINLGGTYDH
jgi:hypothetical protein